MSIRRNISLVTLLALVFTLVFSTGTYAASVSEEKAKLMMAAGEMPAVSTPTEETVKIKREEAIRIARTMLEKNEALELGGTYLNPRYGFTSAVWNIDFFRKEVPGGNVNVALDADTGEILGYNRWMGTDGQQNFVVKMTRAEALVIAENFLKEKMKLKLDDYELQKEDPYSYSYRMGGVREPVTYNYAYARKINGVILPNDSVSVGVDGMDGEVRSYSKAPFTLDISKLPSTEGILAEDKVLDAYKNSVRLALQYVTVYSETGYGPSKPKTILAYVPTTYVDMMDAKTAKVLNYDGSIQELADNGLADLMENPKPMVAGAKLESKAITDDEAKAIAEKFKKMAEGLLKVKFDTPNNGYDRYYNGQEDALSYNWNKGDGNVSYSAHIAIGKKTGHILNMSFNKYDFAAERLMEGGPQKPAEVKEKVSWAKGKGKALAFLKNSIPELYGFYADLNVKEPVIPEESKKYMKEHNYNFLRVVNGLTYRDNSINVSVDRVTGDVKGMYLSWSDVEFPDYAGVITKEAAMGKFLNGVEPRLTYHVKSTYDQASGQTRFDPVPLLVYNMVRKGSMYGVNLSIDAATGKFIDWGGRELRFDQQSPEPQLSEHWAKRSTELLIAQGIIKNPYVEYDAELTRAEAVKMLSLAKGILYYYESAQIQAQTQSFTDVPKDNEYFFFVENAVKQKILTQTGGTFKGDEKITKEEFVKLLTLTMGYGEVAKFSNIYKLDGITAINSDNTGYVAICHALGVLPVQEGKAYDGSRPVTCAEAAVALYKALSFIK